MSVSLVSLVFAACLGVGDSLVTIEGRLVDRAGAPYERCEAALRLAESEEELSSLVLGDRELEEGEFRLSFHVPGRWADCYFIFSCDGAGDGAESQIVRRGYRNPIQLGDIVLERVNRN